MKSKTISYACGRIRRRIDSGAWEAYVIGSSTRRSFRALDDAKAWLDAQEGGNPVTLTAAQMADAARAIALLPDGSTLEAAARAYAARSIAARDVDLEAEVSAYLADCARRLRPPTVAQYRRHLGMALRSPLLGSHLGAHTKAAIRAYIAEQVSSYEGSAALRALSAFYSHLLEMEIITASPADGVRAPKTARKPPSVLTIEPGTSGMSTSPLKRSTQRPRERALFQFIQTCEPSLTARACAAIGPSCQPRSPGRASCLRPSSSGCRSSGTRTFYDTPTHHTATMKAETLRQRRPS